MQIQALFWTGNAKLDSHIVDDVQMGIHLLTFGSIIAMDIDASVLTDEDASISTYPLF